jgi:hypothetical protein
MGQTVNEAAKLMGSLGGKARKKALTRAQRSEIARIAGSAPKKPRSKPKGKAA